MGARKVFTKGRIGRTARRRSLDSFGPTKTKRWESQPLTATSNSSFVPFVARPSLAKQHSIIFSRPSVRRCGPFGRKHRLLLVLLVMHAMERTLISLAKSFRHPLRISRKLSLWNTPLTPWSTSRRLMSPAITVLT